jgi:suppressor for copper-sensitivity B
MTVEGAPDLRGKSVTLVLADNGVAQESRLAIGEAPVVETPHSHCGKWC